MKKMVLSAWAVLMAAAALSAQQWTVFETSFKSGRKYENPFTDVQVDAVFRHGDQQWVVPAFWAGGDTWKVRFTPPTQGDYTYRVECTDKGNTSLNGKERFLHVSASHETNPLRQHGFPRIGDDRHHFTYADGTPFFWLADTWWKELCKRMTWAGFKELTADRKAKGFTVVQIVCGPYPDEGFLQPSLTNEGGLPYFDRPFMKVNPEYFDAVDRRLQYLVDAGITPAIVGAWGRSDCDSLRVLGVAGLERHWRYLIARYSAYPVFWIVAGEISDATKWGQGPWAEVARYIRQIDPCRHPLTCHTGYGRRGTAGDDVVVDFDMVGGSHDQNVAITAQTLALVTRARDVQPPMPVLCGETCYEGHMQQGFQYVQRHIFWMYLLNGAAGHTYGAAGVWHAGVEGDPGVASGAFGGHKVYDWTTWKEGMNYPGSTQLGLGKKLLEQYPWWRFAPHPEWVEPGCFCAGIPGLVRFVYLPRRNIYNWTGPLVKDLDSDIDWHAFYFDPATARRFDLGTIKATARADKPAAAPVEFRKNVPSPQDWVLVLEKARPTQ